MASNAVTVTEGSVSHGTMRREDLIPSFLEAIKIIDVNRDVTDIEMNMVKHGDSYYESDESYYDLERLFDILNEYAPVGMYFGANEGDGSDYGFWRIDDWLDGDDY